MNDVKVITGASEEQIWEQVQHDLKDGDVLEYNVVIEQDGRQVVLTIDIDLGGGFEGGFEMTSLTTLLSVPDDFRFAIHREDFLDEIGKFFGMQDVKIGYPDFDKHVIVKTNDEDRVKSLFADKEVREFFQSVDEDFTLGITIKNHEKELEFTVEKGVTDIHRLQAIYHHFFRVLNLIDSTPGEM